MLKKTDDFLWSDVADKAFEDLKRQLAERLCLRLRSIKSLYCYMWLLMPGRLVWLLLWSVRRRERSIRFNGRFIISVRCLSNQRRGICIGRSWCMGFLWQAGSSNIIFRVILSQWSVQPLWEITFKTEKQLAGLPSGLLSLDLTGSSIHLANPKHFWTSSMIGQSCRHPRKSQITRIGLFILMDPDSWRAWGLESY